MIRLKVSVRKRGFLLRQIEIAPHCLIQDFENFFVGFRQKDLNMLTGSPDNFNFFIEGILLQPGMQRFGSIVQGCQCPANDPQLSCKPSAGTVVCDE